MSYTIKRSHYAEIYGPTTGDRVRLGDTRVVAGSRTRLCRLRRRMQVRRRESAARRHGPGRRREPGRRTRLRDYQRAGRRLHRHFQGRHRHQERADRRHRQGGKSRRDAGRRPAHDRRRDHRSHLGRRADSDRGRDRYPRPLYLPAAGIRRPGQRTDLAGRRRNRTRDGHLRHDLLARRPSFANDAPGNRRPADEFRLSRQGKLREARGIGRTTDRRGDRFQAARGLGHDAGRQSTAA